MSDAPWRDLGIRLASAAVLLPAGLAAIWYGGPVWALGLAAVVGALTLEWAALCKLRTASPIGVAGPMICLAAGLMAWRGAPDQALAILVLGSAGILLWSRRTIVAAGLLYIGIAYLSLLWLRAGPAGLRNVLWLMVVVWAGDIGAYLAGRLIGGPRLAPSISPGKTWSGAVGGTACAVAAGLCAAGIVRPVHTAVLALGLSVVAQAGDLLESAVKRHFGAKDSGWLIPGHGGLLDRLDGVLAAAPVAAAWLLLIGPAHRIWDWGL